MKRIFTFLLLICCLQSIGQKDSTIKKLEKKLEAAATVSEKLDVIKDLAAEYNLENPQACQEILNKGIFIAEESRNREMMIKARRIAGYIYSQMASIKEYSTKALAYTKEALDLSKATNGSFKEKIYCNLQMARLQRMIQNYNDAKKFNETAVNLANEISDDSLTVITKLSYGNTQLASGEKLEAFKTFISAQASAEKSKHKNKDWLEISAYNSLAGFYTSIEDYDRAIDYQYKSLAYAKKNNNKADMFGTMFSIGANYSSAKKYDAAKNIYVELMRIADSLKEPDYKIQGQIGIVNNMISGPEAEKSLVYLKDHPEIKNLFNRINMAYQLDYGMAQIFTVTKQYDSARYYFNKSLPVQEKFSSVSTFPSIYQQYARFLYESGNYPKAISYLNKATLINDSLKNSSGNKDFYEMLDSCYQKTGDYKKAFFYNSLFQKAKVDADEKSKAKDILGVEIDAENKRKERLEKAETEEKNRRHNWQYMGIIVGIVTLFILLTALGLFNVPLKWVRALGFISFIFLFEFIILLADTWIHDFTHGEPLKVIGIKVVLIAMLLPLHHFLEHKVIHYLTNRKHQKNSIGKVQIPQQA
jgi:tetratricopeptide (TPR) repeat protein